VGYGEGSVETEGSVASTTFFLQGRSQAMGRLIPSVTMPDSVPFLIYQPEVNGAREGSGVWRYTR
jgi:hypothetical protein